MYGSSFLLNVKKRIEAIRYSHYSIYGPLMYIETDVGTPQSYLKNYIIHICNVCFTCK